MIGSSRMGCCPTWKKILFKLGIIGLDICVDSCVAGPKVYAGNIKNKKKNFLLSLMFWILRQRQFYCSVTSVMS
jgi:hypothetical protein